MNHAPNGTSVRMPCRGMPVASPWRKLRIRGFSTRRPARGSATRDGRVKGLELFNPPHQPAEPAGPAASVLPQVKSLQLKPVRAKTPKFHGPMLVSQVSGVTRHKVRLRRPAYAG